MSWLYPKTYPNDRAAHEAEIRSRHGEISDRNRELLDEMYGASQQPQGDVGQGAGNYRTPDPALDPSRFNDHNYWLANKEAILQKFADGEL